MDRKGFTIISDLLTRAASAGVFLSCRQGMLHFKLSVDVFPEVLKKEILENKEKLVAFLSQWQLEDADVSSRSPIRRSSRPSQGLPLSFAQQRLWFIDQLGGSVQYNMPGAMQVQGRLDEEVAERALRRIIERHEPLRTVFVSGGEGPRQHIRTAFEFRLTRMDLRSVARPEQEARVREILKSDAEKPFDLSADLMLRACYIRRDEEEGVLLFNMHHIACDGWSMGILVSEFGRLYEAMAEGQADPLPPLAVQYADYAQWQRGWLEGEVLERQLRYWERQLEELPQVHTVPLDRARPAVQRFQGGRERVEVEAGTLEQLKQVAS